MAQEIINIGTSANSKNGEPLRVGGAKINNNFTELYAYGSNDTTTDLSLADLNTLYPSVRVGFEVYCLNINTHKKKYIKSPVGWIEYNITEVL